MPAPGNRLDSVEVLDENIRISFEPFNDYFFDVKFLDFPSKRQFKKRLQCGEATVADFMATLEEAKADIGRQISEMKGG